MKAEKTGKRVIPVILILGIWLILARTAAAAGKAEILLTVQQEFDLPDPSKQEGTRVQAEGNYRLQAVSPTAPMPEGSTKEGYLFSLKGNRVSQELSLCFTENGTYVYTLLQTRKDQSHYSYDRNEYTITVYVSSGEKGQKVSQVIVENKAGEKCGNIKFHHYFKGEESPEPETPLKEKDSFYRKASVKTADGSRTELWTAVSGISGAAILLCLNRKKRTGRK